LDFGEKVLLWLEMYFTSLENYISKIMTENM